MPLPIQSSSGFRERFWKSITARVSGNVATNSPEEIARRSASIAAAEG